MDIESLEKHNDRAIDALSDRLGLLKQVCASVAKPPGALSVTGHAPHTLANLHCRPHMASAPRWSHSTMCWTEW